LSYCRWRGSPTLFRAHTGATKARYREHSAASELDSSSLSGRRTYADAGASVIYLSVSGMVNVFLPGTDAGQADIGARLCNGWMCARRRRAWVVQLVAVPTMSAPAAAYRGELLRRSRRSVHTDVHVHQYFSADLPDWGLAEPRNRGRLASSCTGSHTARRAGAAEGAPICERATSRARSSVIRCVWRRLGSFAEPLVPVSDHGSRHASRGPSSAAGRSQDPELSRWVLHRSGDRWLNRPSIVVFHLASLDRLREPMDVWRLDSAGAGAFSWCLMVGAHRRADRGRLHSSGERTVAQARGACRAWSYVWFT